MTVGFVLSDYVQKVARLLKKEGFKAYLVGGAVRDLVLGIEPKDYDLATDAKPDDMLSIFPKSIATGARFGMVLALIKDSKGETHEVEVTTFRSESTYVDGRWPSKVEFITDLDKDLGRRDFTINAMAIDLLQHPLDNSQQHLSWEIYDPVGGLEDLEKKKVRAVGTPLERFSEDGLRTFKACRIASQLDFEIENETFSSIRRALNVAKLVSMERVRDEFMKLLLNSPKPSKGIELMRQSGLLEIFMPELLACIGVEQILYHSFDVYWHSLRTCDIAPDRIKLAALLHDIGKPICATGDGHFYGHDVEGAKIAKRIMQRMKFSNSEIKRVTTLIRNHMFFYPHIEEGMSDEEIKKVLQHKWSDGAVRRFIARVGEEYLDDLFALRIADATSNPKAVFRPEEIEQLQLHIAKVRAQDMALKISDLQISGDDLIDELGLEPGPMIGKILNQLLEIVLDDPLKNSREVLLQEARTIANADPSCYTKRK